MSSYNPLVSIIIPVYNGSNYLREAIDSAISQTYENIEIIVINDGSTDNGETERIALSYGEKIRYYKKENGGCASALNYGISKMHGEWFSWLSHDDVYLPNKISSGIKVVNEYKLFGNDTVVVCENMAIDSNGKEVFCNKPNGNYINLPSDIMFKRFMNGKSLNGCSLLIPKAILDEIGGFNTEYVYILDWIYWIEIAMKGHAFFEYPEVLVKNRKHKEQVSVKKKEQLGLETNEFILELIDKAIDNRERSIVIWNYCKRIGLKKGCKKISDVYKIPFGNLMKGNVCRLERVARSLFRKFIYRFTR